MSDTSDAFRISLGVQIDTNNIITQIQNMKPPKITLDIDDKDLKTKIQNAVNEAYKGAGGKIPLPVIPAPSGSGGSAKPPKIEDFYPKGYAEKLARIEAGFRTMGKSASDASNDFKQAQATYKAFEDAVNSGNIEKAANLQTLLQKQVRGASSDLSIARNEARGYEKELDAIGRRKLGNYLQKWLDTNTAATKEARMEVQGYINDINNGLITTQSQEKSIRSQMGTIENTQRAMGRLGSSPLVALKAGMSKFTSWISASGAVMQAINEVRNGINTIKELDDGLTNINYTMEVSSKQLKDIGNSAVKASKDLHTSVSTVMDAVKTYANANETAETIIEKSKPTIMMSNVSGMGVENTVDILQGTMEQFDLAEDKLMHISDVMQTVSASMPYDFAKGIRELSEGIQASGSVAKDSGYDLENYTALLGTLISKTRQSGSELGRSLRTMFVRTTKASSSALASGEVTEDDLSNAEAALGRVGIQVRSDLETFRSFDEIMGDLYDKVDSLSEVDLSNIAYEVASTRQTNVFKMMIKAYGEYQGMAEKATKADGITLANQEKYAKSVKGHLGELKATGESIWNNVLNSSELKAGVDTLTVILKLLDGITGKLHGLGTVGLGLGAILGAKNAGGAKMSAPNNNCFKMPATICVLWDTGVFILSDVKYTLVNK